MEKHTIQDGTIPLSGLSPLVVCRQWGSNSYGWVAFPVAFAQFRKLVTNHQGVTWMRTQARESGTLAGFTLDVEDNNKSDCDAQWIAIGK